MTPQKYLNIIFSALIVSNVLTQCASAQTTVAPHIVIYKTKKDYSACVPVVLSDDKKKIVSFPAVSDLKAGNMEMPVRLHKKYWYNKYGVNANTAFLKITIQDYAKLPPNTSAEELYKLIDDPSPITKLCDCGTRLPRANSVDQLNRMIDRFQLHKKCKVYKLK